MNRDVVEPRERLLPLAAESRLQGGCSEDWLPHSIDSAIARARSARLAGFIRLQLIMQRAEAETQ